MQEQPYEDSDEALIRAVRDGQLEQYAALIKRYQQRLYVYCYHLLMQREEAEDAVQDVLIKGYEKLSLYTYNQSFSAWLYKIAYYHCLNLLRKRKVTTLMMKLLKPLGNENVDDGYAIARQKEVLTQMEFALQQLTLVERSLIVLRVIERQSYDEISQSFPQSPTALRKKAGRSLSKLKKIWKELEGVEIEEPHTRRLAHESDIIGRAITPDR
ncbi:RNA polymerase sigma factor [Paenibacillus paeoniae]|uniref:RNA polymerase sigma factor n=1 Tax=Paenibacillus paeoniae TaxID=2292705 RepID=UPI001402CD71|nr:sigma-70 family RNA polymerase sigma factor [Paenibacillus paeoniae]